MDVAEYPWITCCSQECLTTIKQKVCEVISRMSGDSTFEDIQYHLYVLECIERGEREVEDDKTLTYDQEESRPAKGLK